MGSSTEAVTAPLTAIPFEAWPPERLARLVNACQMYKPWYSDDVWLSGEAYRRMLVLARLSNPESRSWEVYRGDELVGLLHADNIVAKQDASCHFVFFDHVLVDKRQLCLNTMDWLFEHYSLRMLRVEIPTYAAKLLGFLRKALGFRFEAEGRAFSWPANATPLTADEAKLGSRKHAAILHGGVLHDLLLLSISADEFRALMKVHRDRPEGQATSGG